MSGMFGESNDPSAACAQFGHEAPHGLLEAGLVVRDHEEGLPSLSRARKRCPVLLERQLRGWDQGDGVAPQPAPTEGEGGAPHKLVASITFFASCFPKWT